MLFHNAGSVDIDRHVLNDSTARVDTVGRLSADPTTKNHILPSVNRDQDDHAE